MSAHTSCRYCRAARLMFTIVMTATWTGMVTPVSASAAPAAGAAEHAQQQVGAILAKLAKIASRELAKPDADPSDVKTKAMELGGDPQKIFRFVRDEIRYEPYRGVLRGAAGALLARSANSFDKSLLLQSMLQANGVACRLVKGELAAEKAAALVEAYLKADSLVGPLAEAGKDPGSRDAEATKFIQSVAAETGLDVNALTQGLDADRARIKVVTDEAWAKVEREIVPLRNRLADAGVKIGQSFEAARKELQARAMQHAWVEVQDPANSGSWIALDPSFAGSEQGTAHTTGQPLELTPSDEHAVTVRLVYRRATDGGAPEDKELINVPIAAHHGGFHFPQLVINPADPLPPPSQLAGMTPEQLIKMMAGIKKFQPALRVGAESYYGQVFDLKGNLFAVATDGRIAGASEIGGAAGGLFGGGALGGSGPPKDDDGPGNFLELSVVIEMTAPGQEPATQKRVLLSAGDVTGDHRKSPMMTWDMLVQPQPMGEKWVANRSVRTLLAALAPMVSVYDKERMAPQDLDALTRARPEPFSGLLMSMALMRERAIARQLKENGGVTALWEAPFVAIAERTFCMNGKSGHACGNTNIDLVDNPLRFAARRDDAGAAAAEAALRQGVFDTVAEALSLRESLNRPGAMTQVGVYSPIDDFARARAAGDKLGVFTAVSGTTPPQELALAEVDRAWVARHERPGKIIVAPSQASADQPTAGWWSIDPVTGSAVGRGPGGRGAALSEKAIITNLVSFAACMVAPTWDAAFNKPSGNKAAIKLSLQMIGCIVGMTFGFAGAGESMMLIWAITGLFLAGADKALE